MAFSLLVGALTPSPPDRRTAVRVHFELRRHGGAARRGECVDGRRGHTSRCTDTRRGSSRPARAPGVTHAHSRVVGTRQGPALANYLI